MLRDTPGLWRELAVHSEVVNTLDVIRKQVVTAIISQSETGGAAEHLLHHLMLVYLLNCPWAPYLEEHDS